MATRYLKEVGIENYHSETISNNAIREYDGSTSIFTYKNDNEWGILIGDVNSEITVDVNMGIIREYSNGRIVRAITNKNFIDSNMSEAEFSYIDLVTLTGGQSGMGKVVIGDYQEWAYFGFKTDGTVNLQMNSSNVVTSSTDGKLVIRKNGNTVRIVNELGRTLSCTIEVMCN